MHPTPARHGAALRDRCRATDWGGVAASALGFGAVVYLGLDGGGFDPLVHDRVGIGVWWLLFAALLAGALPRRRPSALAWVALALLASFVSWTALGLAWTESVDKASSELARVAVYLGVFALALFMRGRCGARRMVGAVGVAVAVVALVALLSRLNPEWFAAAQSTGRFLPTGQERLSYPLNYWNALAGLIAIGVPLLLHLATGARSVALRGLAAAALPMLALTAFFTLSRGGIAAGLVAVALFVALAPDRLAKLAALLLGGAGGAMLIAAAVRREALSEGFAGPLARQQGDELLAIAIVVCLAVGVTQAALSVALDSWRLPRRPAVSTGRSLLATGLATAALLAAALAVGAPNRAADAWQEFKGSGSPGAGAQRLESAAGQGRYQLWVSALDQNATRPLIGRGAGSFEYWWAREGEGGTVRDTHSLYLQTLGELGIIGFLLLVAFLSVVLVGGGREVLRSGRQGSQLAAALAGCVAFCLTAGFDWHWQIPVLPVAFLLLGSVLLGQGSGVGQAGRSAMALPVRAGLAIAAPAAIIAIAIPLASAGLLRESETEARVGDLRSALEAARSAANVQPGAAAPRLQQALVLERMGDLRAASTAAAAATVREKTNWRPWLVLSRIEAQRGRVAPALAAYRRARSLNPHFSLFGP